MKQILTAIFETEQKIQEDRARAEKEAEQIEKDSAVKAAALDQEFAATFESDRLQKLAMQKQLLDQEEKEALQKARAEIDEFRSKLEADRPEIEKQLLAAFLGE